MSVLGLSEEHFDKAVFLGMLNAFFKGNPQWTVDKVRDFLGISVGELIILNDAIFKDDFQNFEEINRLFSRERLKKMADRCVEARKI